MSGKPGAKTIFEGINSCGPVLTSVNIWLALGTACMVKTVFPPDWKAAFIAARCSSAGTTLSVSANKAYVGH